MSYAKTQQNSFILAVIFLAGFTFLLYEVSWHRMLALMLGGTVAASTIVLASFMAGFGTGAYFWGRLAHEKSRVGSLLGGLFFGIGITGGLSYFLITKKIPEMYSSFQGNGISIGTTENLVFAISVFILFVPAFLMGGIFPLSSRIATSKNSSMDRALGRLYAFETLGSTLGGLLTGFFLLGNLGQRNTIFLAVAVNFSVALVIIISRHFNDPDILDQITESQKNKKPDQDSHLILQAKVALVGAFIGGFSILGMQVVWIRMFRIYLTNTSYTFALVSSMAVLGLFVGSSLFGNGHLRKANDAKTMLSIFSYLTVAAGLGLILLVNLPELLMFPFQAALGAPVARMLVLPFVASLLVVFPPSVFSGYAFPLACRMYNRSKGSISKDVGFVLMVNTIGSVLGPIVAAFVLLPFLGAAYAILAVIALLGASILLMLHLIGVSGSAEYLRNFLYGAIGIVLVVIVAGPEIKILPPSFIRFDRDILFYQESVEGTLTVGQDKDTRTRSKYTYVNNSAVIGSTYDAVKVVKMVGHFPFLLGLDCKDVLVIGFGIGVTTSAIASHPEVEKIDCVELVPGLKKAASYYRELNKGVVHDKRLNLIPGDGRHFLQITEQKYDLISCDPTHPILGSGNLYTADYFNLCKEKLNPGGMVSQYLPLHKLGSDEFLGILKTFQSVFPDCTVWLGHYHAVLLGGLNPLKMDFGQWESNVGKLGKDMDFYIEPYHLAATFMLDGATIAHLGEGSSLNTDNLSYTEFFDIVCLDEDNLGRNIKFFLDNRCPVEMQFYGIGDSAKMGKYLAGNNLLTESLYYKFSGNGKRSKQTLIEAARVNPEDGEYPFLIKLYY